VIRWRLLLLLAAGLAAPAPAAEPEAPAEGERPEAGAAAPGEQTPPHQRPALGPPPRLSDRPFQPLAPGRSTVDGRADRDCCDREH
jgi:hypothetical protein